MRRISKFLKDTFTATDSRRLPATSCEMTLHDALRICTGRVQSSAGSAVTRPASRSIGVCRYRSESDLHDQWECLERAPRQATNLTVILVLGDFLRGSLRGLIRRRGLAHRLIIVPHAGYWPGSDSFGDLALSANSLGWKSIELCRDLRDARDSSAAAHCPDEQLLLVLPPISRFATSSDEG